MTVRPDEDLRCSIIIATLNRRELLLATLASIPWEHLKTVRGEVIVIDDGSTDGSAEAVREQFPQAVLHANTANEGLSQAHNRAGRMARGSLLINIDSDVEVSVAWLDAMLAADDGRTIIAGRVMDFITGREQGGPRRSTFLGKSLRTTPERANVAIGCNLAIPKAVFEALGGFDEDLPCYFEDRDICIRARDAGYAVRYVPDASLRHKGSETRVGDAVRQQERNSTWAMLKRYRGKPLHLLAFTLGNGLWLAIRLALWGAKGRFADCRRLLTGWWQAYARFVAGRGAW
ncbi:MAG: glycosyltransferase [Candidatus Hydrogenedens sp.]|nr:glycosyltransferase [Candidatus Hydrogenedens sp.]